jgi:hydrogenase maturation protein HypF
MNTVTTDEISALRITVTGVVQGVGFRPFVYNLARRMGLSGWVLNHSGGVDIEVEGPAPGVAAFMAALEAQAPPLARVATLEAECIAPRGFDTFEIRHSESQQGRYQLISPDVATCPDCRRELFDPEDRRHRYPFTNCTNCGPRFTIIEDIPYDRPKTTMRVFPMCGDCLREYEDPSDRRFHAQPNACPVCGPQVWLVIAPGMPGVDAEAEPLTGDDAIAQAVNLVKGGKVIAVKGLGGFQLVCDATNAEAVALLRERKRRPHKPFAVMAPALDEVKELCELSAQAEAILTSPQAPIVLLDARPNNGIADNVAPNNQTLGVMLPYTPLHHLLLCDAGRPLVMTSGNLSEEPIAKDNDEALRRLAPIADAFLLHNRDIYARYDDSVVAVGYGDGDGNETAEVKSPPLTLRRARGYAPFPVRLPFEAPRILATGPLLKNTFTLTRDDYAFVSQHIGDLENLDTLEHYQEALDTYCHLFRIEPERVACDLHPDYVSTRLAEAFARDHALPDPLRVQHHKAHIYSCMADAGRAPDSGPVIGVAFDGTGYGEDGSIWGGEWFVGDYSGLERVAHLEYLPLPGGDAAIHHPWRIAVAYVHALGLDESLPLGEFCPADVMRIRTMVDRNLNTPSTSSMGRLFDAVSALLGVCHEASYEAQAAIELEQVVGRHRVVPRTGFPFELERDSASYRVHLAPTFEALLGDVEEGVPIPEIAMRFHLTVAEMMTEVSRVIREETGITTVAIGGGVFQNRLLLHLALPMLARAGFEVLLHDRVPSNDGGISLGQAVAAVFAESDRSSLAWP